MYHARSLLETFIAKAPLNMHVTSAARRTAAQRDSAFEDRSLYQLLNKASHLTAFCA